MKKILVILFFAACLNFAQTADSTNSASADSIDLHALVAKQIAAAMEKKENENLNPVQSENPIAVEKKDTGKSVESKEYKSIQADAVPFVVSISAIPWQYKMFAMLTFMIIIFVFARRFALSFSKSSKKAFKKKIGLMREEKVGGSKENPKLVKARRTLKDNLEQLKNANGQISKRAKQLNISKGELLLAARLKLFEVGKS